MQTNNEDRKLIWTNIPEKDCAVSTVFLALDHNFSGIGPPVLWESLVFYSDKSINGEMRRYTSYSDAVKGHNDIVLSLRGGNVLELPA